MVLVFAGAGASAAVDPDKYPTTEGFLERLRDDIKGHPWFKAANSYLDSNGSGSPKDIELVLGALSQMQEYCVENLKVGDFPHWVLTNGLHYLRDLTPDENGLRNLSGDFLKTLERNNEELKELESSINAQVFSLYAAKPSPGTLDTWIKLLSHLAALGLHTEVFTTNYDRVLESAIAEGALNTLGTGMVYDGDSLLLDLEQWPNSLNNTSATTATGLLTKLHGSVNWQRDVDGRVTGSTTHYTGQHQNHILLYPGFKGKPKEEPFITFHNHLRLVAEKAQAAIFIGYAFRDEYINEILVSMPSKIPKIVIDAMPSPPERRFLRGCAHSGDGFVIGSASLVIDFLVGKGVAEK